MALTLTQKAARKMKEAKVLEATQAAEEARRKVQTAKTPAAACRLEAEALRHEAIAKRLRDAMRRSRTKKASAARSDW